MWLSPWFVPPESVLAARKLRERAADLRSLMDTGQVGTDELSVIMQEIDVLSQQVEGEDTDRISWACEFRKALVIRDLRGIEVDTVFLIPMKTATVRLLELGEGWHAELLPVTLAS